MDEQGNAIAVNKRKRSLQFGVRSLLVAMLVVAIAAALFARLEPRVTGLAMEGYCPVTLRDMHSWRLGDPDITATFGTLRYFFVGKAELDKFLENPAHYAIAASGNDVVIAKSTRKLVPGIRRHGYRYYDRTFLFSSESSQNEFSKAPAVYAEFAKGLEP